MLSMREPPNPRPGLWGIYGHQTAPSASPLQMMCPEHHFRQGTVFSSLLGLLGSSELNLQEITSNQRLLHDVASFKPNFNSPFPLISYFF